MKRRIKRSNAAVLACAAFFCACGKKDVAIPAEAAAAAKPAKESGVVAAAGRVEPVSEEIKVGSEIAGRLQQVRIEEGDHVRKGQVIAVLANSDFAARVEEARAELHLREAELDRIVNGSRTEERQEALAATRETEAVMNNAKAEMERRDRLFKSGDISRSEAEQTERDYAVAKARYEEAKEHYALVDAGPRTDEKNRAQAAVEMARAQLNESQARLDKTIIRSPVTGVVLRKNRRAGESVAEGPDTPIAVLADNSTVRVRVDVDESDVGRVRVGQSAYVTADAYGDRKFWGHVVRVGKVLGPKNVRTDEPTERIDTKILETLVELDGHPDLPDGLRVDSYILTGQETGR